MCAADALLPAVPADDVRRARAPALRADRAAYQDALAGYADLTPEQLRVVALGLLAAR